MTDPGWLGYAALFFGALALASVLVPLAMRVAVRYGVLDMPGGHKGHEGATPYLGGAAIALATIAALATGVLLGSGGSRTQQIWVILAALAGVSILGLIDDLRPMPPASKFLGVLAAAIGLWLAGIGVSLPGPDWIDAALTVLWIVGITNAMNLLDNMDGLSAAVATVSSACIFVLASMNGQFLVAALAATIAGSALGFLRLNRPPARIFMGDSGSLFLGLMLAVLGLGLRFPGRPESVTALVPILILAVPILDTTMVVVTRRRDGRPITKGHRDHLSHRLRAAGLDVRGAVGVLLLAQLALGWLAIMLSRSADTATAWMTAGFAGVVGVGAVLALLRIPMDPNTGARLTQDQLATHSDE